MLRHLKDNMVTKIWPSRSWKVLLLQHHQQVDRKGSGFQTITCNSSKLDILYVFGFVRLRIGKIESVESSTFGPENSI